MTPLAETDFRDELAERRRRLQEAIAAGGEGASLGRLLGEVDAALVRLDKGTFGECEVCHEGIEIERLFADPLRRTCLDHLTQAERRALEEDLALASRVQEGLLPREHLSVPGWEAFYRYEPAGAVSGDYCDLVPHGQDLYFLLGDVAGKGMGASLLMSALRSIVRTLADAGPPVRTLVERANRLFSETALPQHYATLVCGRASSSGEIEICNAGHCPPLVSSDGSIEPVKATGLPIGLFSSAEYSTRTLRLGAGETLLLYTDGVSEARGRTGEEYGRERLAQILGRRRGLPPKEIVAACLEDLVAFRGAAARTDDLTLLAVRRAPASR